MKTTCHVLQAHASERGLLEKVFFVGILILLSIPKYDFAQKPSSYKMNFIRACSDSSSKGNYIVAVFQVLPLIKDFKLILSMKVTYQLQHGEEIVHVLKQKEDNIKIVIYGKNVEEKNKWMYDFIKDSVQIETAGDLYLIEFFFNNLTEEKVTEMSITYGLWESNNQDIRNEKKFDFNLEKCH